MFFSLAKLIPCLSGFIPASGLAAPDMARATAMASARVLAPVAVGYSVESQQTLLRVSSPNDQVFQQHQDSYQQALPEQDSPLPITASSPNLAQSDFQQPPVTLYFN